MPPLPNSGSMDVRIRNEAGGIFNSPASGDVGISFFAAGEAGRVPADPC
jgi:hypothetical protein